MPSPSTLTSSRISMVIMAQVALLSACDPDDPPEADVEFLVQFEADEHPEGLDMAPDGTLYVGIANTGEIRAVGLDGTMRSVARVDIGDVGFMPGLTLSDDGRIFVTAWSIDEGADARGLIYEVAPSGEVELFSEFPPESYPNHITIDSKGTMYVSESTPGRIFRIAVGSTEPELWSDDPRLLGVPVAAIDGIPLGANGSVLSADEQTLYVSNSSTQEILSIPIDEGGSPGELTCYAGVAADCEIDVGDALRGPDGLAFDVDGRLYAASGTNDSIVRFDVDGTVDTLWTSAPLGWPTVLVFGTTPETETTLFTTNIDIGRFFDLDAGGVPVTGIVMLDVGVEGQ